MDGLVGPAEPGRPGKDLGFILRTVGVIRGWEQDLFS